MVNHLFAWYNVGDSVKSRLDRFLVSQVVGCETTSAQYVVSRDISYHYSLILKYNQVNWESKPFVWLMCG